MIPPPQDPSIDLQRLLAEEPSVRSLARSLAGADPDDVVQQTFLQALQQRGPEIERPRSWLLRIVRNVAANLRRGERRRELRQRAVAVQDLVPSSAELMEQEERRRELVAAVDALPPSLRTVVLLRWFEGLPPRRIGKVLGVPAATVSTQLQRALAQLRQRLDERHGGVRRAWLLPLWEWARRPRTQVPMPLLPVITGAIAMTTKTKLVSAAAVLLAAAGAIFFWPDGGGPPAEPVARGGPGSPPAAAAGLPGDAAAPPETGSQRQVAAAAPAPVAATTGALLVRVRHADDHAPAAGITMIVHWPATDARVEGRRQRVDDSGTARFPELPPGRWSVEDDRGSRPRRAEIEAGSTAELDYEVEAGLAIHGVVVDAGEVPVAGALVEVAPLGHADADAEVMATTAPDGKFAVRAAPPVCLVGARAPGHQASALRFLTGKAGNAAEVRLQLGGVGGTVEGVVTGPDGAPVGSAVVLVGSGSTSGLIARGDSAPPIPALVRSDAEGRFRAVGIAPGEQPVQARAAGFAPWHGQCTVTANLVAPLRVTLVRGASVRGLVRDGSGAVLADAEVEVGEWQQLAHWRTLTGADGAFELRGLPAGEIVIAAEHDDAGKASTPLLVPEAGTIACELQLSRGLELRGRVLDDAGAPVPKAMVECMSSRPVGGSWFASFVNTDAEGRFSVANCPEGDTLTVSVRGKEIEELRRTGVDPTAGECELRVRRGQPRSVRIRGTVIAHDGRPVANAWADARRQGTRDSSGMIATDNDGRFELGPVAPGAWRVFVRSSEHPEFTSEPRELAAEAVWDLGRIQLAQGGTALVQVLGERAGVRFQAVDVAETRTWGVDERDGALRTSVLAPGAYRLLVSGGSTAVQAVPFAILAGAETQVGVRLQPGTRQRFELELPATLETGDYVRVRVERGADLIGRASATVQRGEPCATELQLLPGSYVATAIGKELRARAEFTVGAAEAAPVRLSLR